MRRLALLPVLLTALLLIFPAGADDTAFASGPAPDLVRLTFSGDPATTRAVTWRTDGSAGEGYVAFGADGALERKAAATVRRVEGEQPENDRVNLLHTAVLTGLEPGTAYTYTVGDGEHRSEPVRFTTAPSTGDGGFSFVYMGDAQRELGYWGKVLRRAFRDRPEAAFYLMAGDLVNDGEQRWEWDQLFGEAKGVWDRRVVAPAPGNHDCPDEDPDYYLQQFALPGNGPDGLKPGQAYAFEYGNALFVSLDSNVEPAEQADWLEGVLRESDAMWKFALYHHPAYSSRGKRDNAAVREVWGALFDAYGVDIAFQGHDHAYLRTKPMRDGKPAPSGTVYVVSNSGGKHYGQDDHDYRAVGFEDVSTWQVVEVETNPDRLRYVCYDVDGRERDAFVIEK